MGGRLGLEGKEQRTVGGTDGDFDALFLVSRPLRFGDRGRMIFFLKLIYPSHTRRDQVNQTTSKSNNLFAALKKSAIDLPPKMRGNVRSPTLSLCSNSIIS